MHLIPVLVTVNLFATAYAAIGPVSDIHIVNKDIAPDGFTRSCVNNRIQSSWFTSSFLDSAVLAGQTAGSASFPGPVITGFKVEIYAS